MSENILVSEPLIINAQQDAYEKAFSPVAKSIGEWRMLANSPQKSRRKQAIKKAPIVLADISKYKSALEEALQYIRYEEDIATIKDFIEQINEQVVKINNLRAVRIEEFVAEYRNSLENPNGNPDYLRP